VTARLKAEFWVKAHIRRCRVQDVEATLVRRGDDSAGAVLIKLNMLENGTAVLTQTRDANGDLVWLQATGAAPVSDADADAYIARQLRVDSDLWVIEIEDRAGRHCLDEPVRT
jgi:GMP synthase (glutamine-hydrolysing)